MPASPLLPRLLEIPRGVLAVWAGLREASRRLCAATRGCARLRLTVHAGSKPRVRVCTPYVHRASPAQQGRARGGGPSPAERAPWVSPADGLFVTDYFTRTPRKLSPFRSFASIELFHFHIPEDTVIAVWNLITFKEQGGTFGDHCPDRSITV